MSSRTPTGRRPTPSSGRTSTAKVFECFATTIRWTGRVPLIATHRSDTDSRFSVLTHGRHIHAARGLSSVFTPPIATIIHTDPDHCRSTVDHPRGEGFCSTYSQGSQATPTSTSHTPGRCRHSPGYVACDFRHGRRAWRRPASRRRTRGRQRSVFTGPGADPGRIADAVGGPLPSQPVSSSPSTPTGPSTPGDEWAAARAKLDRLAVINGTTGHDYDRQMFGQTWADVDRNGCDTRNDILRRDLDHVRIKAGTHGCKVLSGILSDPYSGAVVQFTSGPETSWDVQIDHVVPLAWAWRHGADDWTTQRRTEFANDPQNLLATTAEVNMSKSDSGPSEWLPNSAAEKCDYASTYIDVLTAWDLAINGDDRTRLRQILTRCTASAS